MPTSLLHLAYWIHTPTPFLIRFGENAGIRYYGLAYVLGFVAGGWLLRRYYSAGRTTLNFDATMDLVVAVVAGTILGGRLGYFILYQPSVFLHEPLALLRVWEGGMASHGAFIGIAIALAVYARRYRVPFLHLGDLIVSTAPVGILLGRLANFLNGELWGKPSEVPWAMIFMHTGGGTSPRHPSQLYEAAAEGLVLLAYVQWRFWKTDATQRSPGRLAGEFLIGYALVRMFCELFREPDAALILGLSRGTFYSFFLIAAGLLIIALSLRRAPLAPR